MKRHLVLDCDPGCDDALALLLALRKNVYSSIDVLTVAGNVGIEQVTQNARRLIATAHLRELFDPEEVEIQVFRGSQSNLRGERPGAASVHGRDGLGDVPLQVFAGTRSVAQLLERYPQVEQSSAVEHLRSFAFAADGVGPECEFDLVCTGPLTNLASALNGLSSDEKVGFWNRWKRVVIMGGALAVPGNVTYSAEFNAHADADALAIVLRSAGLARAKLGRRAKPALPILVPLDLTERVVLWAPQDLQKAHRFRVLADSRQLILCILRKYFLFHAISYPPPLPLAVLREEKNLGPRHWRLLDRADHLRREREGRGVKDRFETSRRRGGGGLKELPLWCFLHDPAALWIAMTWDVNDRSAFYSRHVTVEAADRSTRGHLQPAHPRRSFFSKADEDRGDLYEVWVPEASRALEDLRGPLLTELREMIGTGADAP